VGVRQPRNRRGMSIGLVHARVLQQVLRETNIADGAAAER
jgi:hypothetical protein